MLPNLKIPPKKPSPLLTRLQAAEGPAHVAEVVDYLHRPIAPDAVREACDFPLSRKHENDTWTVGASWSLRHARRAWHDKRWAAAAMCTALAVPGIALTATICGSSLGLICFGRAYPRPRTQLGVLEDRIAREVKALLPALDWHPGPTPLDAAQVNAVATAARMHLDRLTEALQRLPESRLRHSRLILPELRKARCGVDATHRDLLQRLEERRDIAARCAVEVR